MNFPFKLACLLLSLMLLLNVAGFAAMLGCDQECCQPSPRRVSTQSNSIGCHEAEEMGPASDAVLQVENRPMEAPPLNFVQCATQSVSASFLTAKADFRCDLAAASPLEQIVVEPKNHRGEPAAYPSSPPLSQPITAPMRN